MRCHCSIACHAVFSKWAAPTEFWNGSTRGQTRHSLYRTAKSRRLRAAHGNAPCQRPASCFDLLCQCRNVQRHGATPRLAGIVGLIYERSRTLVHPAGGRGQLCWTWHGPAKFGRRLPAIHRRPSTRASAPTLLLPSERSTSLTPAPAASTTWWCRTRSTARTFGDYRKPACPPARKTRLPNPQSGNRPSARRHQAKSTTLPEAMTGRASPAEGSGRRQAGLRLHRQPAAAAASPRVSMPWRPRRCPASSGSVVGHVVLWPAAADQHDRGGFAGHVKLMFVNGGAQAGTAGDAGRRWARLRVAWSSNPWMTSTNARSRRG